MRRVARQRHRRRIERLSVATGAALPIVVMEKWEDETVQDAEARHVAQHRAVPAASAARDHQEVSR